MYEILNEQEEVDESRCEKCRQEEGTSMEHTCPYSVEMYGDSDSLCNCCWDCERNCAGDI